MTVENISLSISTKESCQTRQESNLRSPDQQLDTYLIEPRSYVSEYLG